MRVDQGGLNIPLEGKRVSKSKEKKREEQRIKREKRERALTGLYSRVFDVCNSDQIAAILRRYKNVNAKTEEEIRVGGSKIDLVENLRRVVALKLVPLEDVRRTLTDAEENGSQHIFYFTPVNEEVADSLREFPSRASKNTEVPRENKDIIYKFPRQKNGFAWVDMRESVAAKSNDWLIKAYARDQRREKISEKRSDGQLVVTYDIIDVDVIYVLRWNEPGLLEVRMSTEGITGVSKKKQRLKLILSQFAALSGVESIHLKAWDLESATTNLMAAAVTHDNIEIGDSALVTAGGKLIQASGVEEDESLYDDPDAAKAFKQLLKKDSRAESVVVRWALPKHLSGYKLPVTLSAQVGGRFSNEVVVTSQVSAKVIDYLTNELRSADRNEIPKLKRMDLAISVLDTPLPWEQLDRICAAHPEFERPLRTITSWVKRNRRRRTVSVRELARLNKSTPADELASAIALLVSESFFTRMLGVFDPQGALIAEFSTDTELPETISSRDKSVEYAIDDLRVASVYRYG